MFASRIRSRNLKTPTTPTDQVSRWLPTTFLMAAFDRQIYADGGATSKGFLSVFQIFYRNFQSAGLVTDWTFRHAKPSDDLLTFSVRTCETDFGFDRFDAAILFWESINDGDLMKTFARVFGFFGVWSVIVTVRGVRCEPDIWRFESPGSVHHQVGMAVSFGNQSTVSYELLVGFFSLAAPIARRFSYYASVELNIFDTHIK